MIILLSIPISHKNISSFYYHRYLYGNISDHLKTIDLQIIEIHFEDDPFHFRIPIDMCFNLSLLKISQ